jgi:TniQ
MSSSEAVMPIALQAYPDESGVGFCLRSINANGATLHGLRRLVGIENIGSFTSKHAVVLARIFQAPSSWFEKALPSFERSSPYRRDLYGHRWFYRNHLRSINPQVCIECIHLKGYCRAVWDVTLATVCSEHKCYLVDLCAQCAKPLRWDRPSVDVGHCRHVLKQASRVRVTQEILDFQDVLESHFQSNDDVSALVTHFLHRELVGLSLSGLLTVVVAFGFMTKPYESVHSTVRSKSFSPAEWSRVVERALPRLQMFFDSSFEPSRLAPLVIESLLENMACNHDSVVDQSFAIRSLAKLFDRKISAHWGTRFEHLSQLPLF